MVFIPCWGMLDWELTGLCVAEGNGKTMHFAYADNVTHILTQRFDITLWEFIHI